MGIISKESIDICKDKVKFSYDEDKIAEVIDDIALEIGKNNKIKGYRKGKAPLAAIKQLHKKHIMDVAKQRLVSEAFEDILFDCKWKPFGQPSLNEITFNSRNFYVEMVIGYNPTFELTKYKDFDLESPDSSVNVESFKSRMIEAFCEEFGEMSPLEEDDFVLLGDEVCISYVGKIDGEDFKNNVGENVKFVVGQGKALKEIEDEIIGMSIGEKREVDIEFSENFAQEDVKGKKAVFNVELKSANRKTAAEFGDDLIKKAGFKDTKAFNGALEMKAKEKIAEHEFLFYREQINKKLIEENDIEVPEWMKMEITKNMVKMQNKKWEDISDEDKNLMMNSANDKLKLAFILDYIKDKEVETCLSDTEILGTMQSNIHRFPEEIRKQLISGSNPRLMTQIAGEIQDEHLLRWLINQSVKKEEDKN